ncbi:hypothetical protein Y032_0007g3560 [Ancylostoma ceylanicum]|uniref:Uncharacterized protein n=1 Tax=Ancylostoma ceylanicum TaxID=53326 RepID=A0A016VQP9_9BILA|nr:hypothetical protein Y032_0007g3560 [Ancylostoma ceylanicum]
MGRLQLRSAAIVPDYLFRTTKTIGQTQTPLRNYCCELQVVFFSSHFNKMCSFWVACERTACRDAWRPAGGAPVANQRSIDRQQDAARNGGRSARTPPRNEYTIRHFYLLTISNNF